MGYHAGKPIESMVYCLNIENEQINFSDKENLTLDLILKSLAQICNTKVTINFFYLKIYIAMYVTVLLILSSSIITNLITL